MRLLRIPIVLVASAYLAGLGAWWVAYLFLGDRNGYLGIVNSLAHLLFLPLPLVLVAAVAWRSRVLLVGGAAATTLFLMLWGDALVPRTSRAVAAGESLTVLSFNGLGTNRHLQDFLEAIRQADADVVCLQELSPEQADALRAELRESYPHQALEPRRGVRGMGVVSRYPLASLGETIPSAWSCRNQALRVDWNGREVALLNVHLLPFPENLREREKVTDSFRQRETEAEAVAEIAARTAASMPVVVAGDTNVSSINRAYRILTRDLDDAWKGAGAGFGHTFPNRRHANHGGVKRIGVPVPSWLVRIDYVFHSEQWRATAARTTRSAGRSDHRGVVATLALREAS